MDESRDEDNSPGANTNTPREREQEETPQDAVIFESGLRAIASLATIQTNSQSLSDGNVGDIV